MSEGGNSVGLGVAVGLGDRVGSVGLGNGSGDRVGSIVGEESGVGVVVDLLVGVAVGLRVGVGVLTRVGAGSGLNGAFN